MKTLKLCLEGLLNKSNKSSVLNAGDEIKARIQEKAAKENRKGSVDWNPVKKVLTIKGSYNKLLDGEIINLLRTIPGATLKLVYFSLSSLDDDLPEDIIINFNIEAEYGSNIILNDENVSVENCTFEITDGFGQSFDMHGGDLSFTNVKFIGSKNFITSGEPGLKIKVYDPKSIPTFKNVELWNMSLVIECPVWREYYKKVKGCIRKGTDPGNVMKMFGLDGIKKENFKGMRNQYIEIRCPFEPGRAFKESMKISRVKPEDKKHIEQNGWFIYFS